MGARWGMEYNHPEAFNMMKYASDDRTVVEFIWNSRDGVTPFMVMSQDGKTQLTHVDWRGDIRMLKPDLKPGQRIFVDMTPARAAYWAKERMDCFVGSEYELKGEEREQMEQTLAHDFLRGPDLIESPTSHS